MALVKAAQIIKKLWRSWHVWDILFCVIKDYLWWTEGFVITLSQVSYSGSNWLEKNRDTFPSGIMNALLQSKNKLINRIFKGKLNFNLHCVQLENYLAKFKLSLIFQATVNTIPGLFDIKNIYIRYFFFWKGVF